MARRINLVPPSERPRTTTDVGVLVFLVIAIVLVFGLGFGYYILHGQLQNKREEAADLDRQVAQVEAEIAALYPYEVLKLQRDEMEGLAQGIFSARTAVSGILDDVSLVIPDTVWLQSMNLTVPEPLLASDGGSSESASVRGGSSISVVGTTYTFEDVAELLVRFQLVPSLRNVQLLSADGRSAGEGGQGLKNFSLSGSVLHTPTDEQLPITQIQVEAP